MSKPFFEPSDFYVAIDEQISGETFAKKANAKLAPVMKEKDDALESAREIIKQALELGQPTVLYGVMKDWLDRYGAEK